MITELLTKYKDKKPMDFKTTVERSYPVSAAIDMMTEYAQHKLEVQYKEIENWLIINTSLEVDKIVDLRLAMAEK